MTTSSARNARVNTTGSGTRTSRIVRRGTLLLLPLALSSGLAWLPQPAPDVPSSSWLSLLPDGETKRKFILDCTGCHQLDARMARPQGVARTRDGWAEAITRMLGYAGATTGFPVIAHDRDAATTADWLAANLARDPVVAQRAPRAGTVTEFDISRPNDLPHDVAINGLGDVIVTGMFTHNMYLLHPATGRVDTVAIPVPNANPRAVEIDKHGNWWVVLGARHMIARYEPSTRSWKTWPAGFYPHSLAIDSAGGVWANGHFTKAPELVTRVDTATGRARSDTVPAHPSLAEKPGGPIPYEIRVAPDGVLWMSELQGNRMVAVEPRGGRVQTYEMPVSWSGPRRFDVDRNGVLWIPAYSDNSLVRFDPESRRFTRYELPIKDAVPYVARVNHRTNRVWVGTAAADAILEFDPESGAFDVYPLPTRGALVRHLAIDPRNSEVWAAYGESPGKPPSRIARIRPARAGSR